MCMYAHTHTHTHTHTHVWVCVEGIQVAGRHARVWQYQGVGIVNFSGLRFEPGKNVGIEASK
jgi:hypothetical protein